MNVMATSAFRLLAFVSEEQIVKLQSVDHSPVTSTVRKPPNGFPSCSCTMRVVPWL